MKKSKITLIAVLAGAAAIACILICFLMNRRDKDSNAPDDDLFSSAGETDYLDDPDAPVIADIPEKEEKPSAKVRRGYIPIRLGRE